MYWLNVAGSHPKNVLAMADKVSKAPGRHRIKKACPSTAGLKTNNDRIHWTKELALWHKQHKAYLLEKTIHEQTGRYWYKHKLIRRSYLTIKRALPNMFHYLSNPLIPNTTNGIEGFFSHLKNHLDLHRGLTLKHRIDFIKWYVYLSNDK